jgi:D-alanyl-lipoteichoic acid acyltransferase DltB (MBOAT superfamily)
LFLPVTLAGFFGLARLDRRAAASWLTAASLFFYGWWNPSFVVLLAVSIGFNYLMGLAIARASGDHARGTLMAVGVGANLAVLAYYKYAGFLLSQVLRLPGATEAGASLVLPLGISFFTFTQIAFLVDVRRGLAREYSPIHYALFVTYFPHLIAGPVLHHKEMMPQFARDQTYRPEAVNFSVGLTMLALGLFKKVILADGCAAAAAAVFDTTSPATRTFFAAWTGALSYTLQIYFDFSGYSDMAAGLSKLFGVVLPLNFNSPYKADNIIEFWRRWHMSLSRFLRDYLYIPLGGNRHGPLRRQLNLALTMLLGGLWHGASWTFVVWGGLHGLYLMINHAWRGLRGDSAGPWPAAERLTGRLLTFATVVAAWVFFRAKDFPTAGNILAGMVGFHGAVLPEAWLTRLPAAASWAASRGASFGDAGGFGGAVALRLVALLAIVWGLPNVAQLMTGRRPVLDEPKPSTSSFALSWHPSPAWLVAAVALGAAAFVMISGGASEFLYYQF